MAPPPPLEANVTALPDTYSLFSLPPPPPPPPPPTQPIAVTTAPLPWRQTFISLKVRNFRIFAIGHFIAVIALWMQRIAQDWLVLQLSGSVTAVGSRWGCSSSPSSLRGRRMMADRFAEAQDPDAVPVGGGQCWRRSSRCSALTQRIEVWHVYVIALALGLVTVLVHP